MWWKPGKPSQSLGSCASFAGNQRRDICASIEITVDAWCHGRPTSVAAGLVTSRGVQLARSPARGRAGKVARLLFFSLTIRSRKRAYPTYLNMGGGTGGDGGGGWAERSGKSVLKRATGVFGAECGGGASMFHSVRWNEVPRLSRSHQEDGVVSVFILPPSRTPFHQTFFFFALQKKQRESKRLGWFQTVRN